MLDLIYCSEIARGAVSGNQRAAGPETRVQSWRDLLRKFRNRGEVLKLFVKAMTKRNA